MTKVITYGTFDMLHYGHIKLLERAKSLGDYLIVGVTSDDFDKTRGKINSRQTLMERIAAIENTGIADEVIIEEYEGQKIDDIIKYNIDIFTVGSDWVGKFDYLNDYCKVIYLPRTQGVSSSNLRANTQKLKIGLLGDQNSELTSLSKFIKEVEYVNGVEIVCSNKRMKDIEYVDEYFDLLEHVDAVYITTHPKKHYQDIKTALLKGKHVLCESPITVNKNQCQELFELAQKNNCVLMEGIKTAYSTAYSRLILLAKSGKIGEILSVDATCTTLKDFSKYKFDDFDTNWNTITEWGSLALMPIVQILGTTYLEKRIVTRMLNTEKFFDGFTKIDFLYKNAVASLKVAKAAKSEGELIITGTDGYIYVPSPWWKTDYFEVRYENPNNNQRYFYQLDGEGIRYEIVAFAKAIATNSQKSNIRPEISITIAGIMDDFYNKKDIYFI